MPFETLEQLERLDSKLKCELGVAVVMALENPDVIEICINSDGRIWLEEKTKHLYDSGNTISAEKLTAALGTVAAMSGKELNSSKPKISAKLPLDGSRVEGTIPPLSPDGPSVCIRKHASTIFPLSKYVDEKRIPKVAAEYLADSIRNAKNIVVAGGTSSGKTTFVNALIREMFAMVPQDRLLVIEEDPPELHCATTNKQNFVATEEVTMQSVMKTAMRYRPDRIIIGEVRGGEALDLLKSWNTGHPGGFATLHANSAPAALIRLEQLVAEASKSPLPALIAEAANIIVYMQEFGKVGRQVTEIIRVTGYKKGEYVYETVYESGEANRRKNG
ncbi:conjugal transfer protein TrbB [Synergistales bacterium]|nr:conjugal transfer protein TrbB [Synergistales bacterium]